LIYGIPATLLLALLFIVALPLYMDIGYEVHDYQGRMRARKIVKFQQANHIGVGNKGLVALDIYESSGEEGLLKTQSLLADKDKLYSEVIDYRNFSSILNNAKKISGSPRLLLEAARVMKYESTVPLARLVDEGILGLEDGTVTVDEGFQQTLTALQVYLNRRKKAIFW
jgi:hypothetical protein